MPDGLLGFNKTKVYTDVEMLADGDGFSLGQTVRDYDGKQYAFYQAAGAIAAGGTATVAANIATAGAGTFTAQAALTAGQRGWFLTSAALEAAPTSIKVYSGHTVTPVP